MGLFQRLKPASTFYKGGGDSILYCMTQLSIQALYNMYSMYCPYMFSAEAEFLNVIGIKVLRVFLLAIHSHLY